MPHADYHKIIETVDSEIKRLEAELANLRKVREAIIEAEKILPPSVTAKPIDNQPPPAAPLGEAEQRLQKARQKAAEEMATRRAKR